MKVVLRRVSLRRVLCACLSVALLASAASVASAGAVEVAKARPAAGRSSVTHAGRASDVGDATQFQEGDVVDVPTDGRLVAEFGDGGSITLTGPAKLQFVQITGEGRRVILLSGVADATAGHVAMELRAPEPYVASLVLQNARGSARVNPGEQVTFARGSEGHVQVWDGRTPADLGASPWVLRARGAAAAPKSTEIAKVRTNGLTGTPTVIRAGRANPIAAATQFEEGDIVRVPEGSRLTVEFADGATLALAGAPTTLLRFGPLNPTGRVVVLGSGVITDATVRGVAMEIQAPDPYDASIVLQNARAFARVDPGESVVFQKNEGVYAKVWYAGQSSDLGDVAWRLNARDRLVAGGPGRPVPVSRPGRWDEEPVAPDGVRMHVAGKTIVYHPASKFSKERTDRGGLLLCFRGADDEWGVVELGFETTLYLAKGQCVEFDENGDVIRFDGISHVYHPLFDTIFNEEPVENAADASPSFGRRR
jgi:hypothetical protein